MWVRALSRSFKMVQFVSLGAVSYSPSIATMALSCISSEIKLDIGRKSWFFYTSALHSALLFGCPRRNIAIPFVVKNYNGRLPEGEKTLRICITVICITVHNTGVWQTDRQTFCHGIVRAITARRVCTRRAVKKLGLLPLLHLIKVSQRHRHYIRYRK